MAAVASDKHAAEELAVSYPVSAEDEAIIVAFRKHTLLSLDDCLYALQATIPHLTRSSLIAAFSVTESPAFRTWRTAKA